MAYPVQHLAVIVNQAADGQIAAAALNADYPVGYPNAWTDNPETDPSTNNLSNRNMLAGGVPRVLRTGGSGRPQFRDPSAECICREYRIEYEDTTLFTLCTDMLPLNYAQIMIDAGLGFTANNAIWYATTLPTLAEINDLAALDSGWVSAGAVCTDAQDSPCP